MTLEKYNPAEIEDKWYQYWMERNLFAPTMDDAKEAFCIVIPPPNVTGSLHMGHAWDNTIQDILTRWQRMHGKNTLWLPGMDHAGIATQWMVERQLRDQGQTKEELGREKFLEEAWKFKESSHETIARQLRRMGVSCDWGRERFTLDEGLSKAVRRVFVSLYNEGLIYRDNRMVSWCPRCLTALSDLEVNPKDTEGRLWEFRYPFADGSGDVIVATTRPETMLGDTAVAVHPEDERYQQLMDKTVRLPLTNREVPLVADDYVDPEFGTGAVKITPSHDPNDFEIARRHDLPFINVMNEDGTLNESVPEAYQGLDRYEARKKVLADLDALGLLVGEKKHQHAIGTCSRCSTVIEPRVSEQWFAKMADMARESVKAVEEKRIELIPEFQEKIFYEWMNNIQDWCISRQLWWGHRIPVWYCNPCGAIIVSEEDDVHTCNQCGSDQLTMEEDVLDTWFSSGLWPFSTMGWPEKTKDLTTFYPTSVLVTGYDILFFWVARMAMLGIKFMDQVPFHQVLLHGLLRDKNGEKMSKTKGNGLDPLDMIDSFGADALRYTLAAGTVLGRDMVLQEATIEGYRNFINKIWNANRFALGHQENLGAPKPLESQKLGTFDQWILSRLATAASEADQYLQERRFNEAAKTLYQFVWHELCDWYVEISKPALYGEMGEAPQQAAHSVLHAVLADSLKLLHPFMPFVTEELWSNLPGTDGSIMVQQYPVSTNGDGLRDDPTGLVEKFIEVVQSIRGVRGESNIKPKQKIDVVMASQNDALRKFVAQEQQIFSTLANIGELKLESTFEKQEGYGHGVGDGFEVFLSLAGLIDVSQERQRIGKEAERTQEKIEKLAAKLGNPNFTDKAPAEVVEKNRQELASLQEQLAKLNDSLGQLPPG